MLEEQKGFTEEEGVIYMKQTANRKDVAKYEIFKEAKMKMCAFYAFNLECPKMFIHRSCNYMHDGRIL